MIMVPGTRKIPLPITVPTTIAMAWLTPNSRTSSGRSCAAVAELGTDRAFQLANFRTSKQHAHNIPNSKCHSGSQRDIPGPGNRREQPNVKLRGEARCHAHGGASGVRLLGQHPKQEHA